MYMHMRERAARECVYKAGWLAGWISVDALGANSRSALMPYHTYKHTHNLDGIINETGPGTESALREREREREHHTLCALGIFGIWGPLVKLAPTASARTPKLNFPKSQFFLVF
jgi:hypothetical protein